MKVNCPLCKAENEPLGRLGNRVHFSCSFCGMGYSRQVKFKTKKVAKKQARDRRQERLVKQQVQEAS
jgi:transposase-like protein